MAVKAHVIRGSAERIPLADASVDLVVASPPYANARLYLEDGEDPGISRKCEPWIEWMLGVTAEALRVSRGPVIWVAAGVTRGRNYWPAVEGLIYRWWQQGGHLYRPVIWTKNGIPGSGGDDWFRADWEFCACFKRPGALPWSDNTACGHTPVYASTGPMSNRMVNGARADDPFGTARASSPGGRRPNGKRKPMANDPFGFSRSNRGRGRFPDGTHKPARQFDVEHTKREPDGTMRIQKYAKPKIANPGTVLHVEVGGGRMGHPMAHDNDAPYPLGVPEFFVKSLCPPGGTVLDCFCGSGTTLDAALRHGRNAIGIDLRASQCDLTRRRLATPYTPGAKRAPKPQPGEMLLPFAV